MRTLPTGQAAVAENETHATSKKIEGHSRKYFLLFIQEFKPRDSSFILMKIFRIEDSSIFKIAPSKLFFFLYKHLTATNRFTFSTQFKKFSAAAQIMGLSTVRVLKRGTSPHLLPL